jgi:hypothetical protein
VSAPPQLAQLNVAELLAPLDSPQLAEFNAMLEPVNAGADAAPGFVWRLQGDDGNATEFRAFDSETMLINLSVWESIEALRGFVYGAQPSHKAVMARRREWFAVPHEAHQVLWWIPAGHRPDPLEAEERLLRLRAQGPSAAAFTFRADFPAPLGVGAPGVELADSTPGRLY